MGNLLFQAITYVKNIGKKKPTVKRLLAHISSVRANNWDESVVEETLCILHTKGITNENYKILTASGQKATPNQSVFTESLKEENLTKTLMIKSITENQYLSRSLSTQSLSNTKEPYNTRLEIIHNCIIDLTKK